MKKEQKKIGEEILKNVESIQKYQSSKNQMLIYTIKNN